jgi:hypothetical protein
MTVQSRVGYETVFQGAQRVAYIEQFNFKHYSIQLLNLNEEQASRYGLCYSNGGWSYNGHDRNEIKSIVTNYINSLTTSK